MMALYFSRNSDPNSCNFITLQMIITIIIISSNVICMNVAAAKERKAPFVLVCFSYSILK